MGGWEKTQVVRGKHSTVVLQEAAADQRGVVDAFRKLSASMSESASHTLPEMLKELEDAKRRALLFELVSRTRRQLQQVHGPAEVLAMIPKLVFGSFMAERVVVMLWDQEKQCLKPSDVHLAPAVKAQETEVALSTTLLNMVLGSRTSVLVRDAAADPALLRRESIVLSGLRSAICAPMIAQDRLYGLVYADNCRMPMAFDEDDLEVLSVFAMEAALAFDVARARTDRLQQERVRDAYRRFLPEHLVDLVISSPDAVQLGGTRQNVTALFADLRGFTSLAETLPPEEAVDLLNSFFREMTAIIFRHGGTLDKYLGDGLLAVFGAPISDAGDPLRAVRCGIDMQNALRELSREWEREGRPVIPMGIGINSGDAIAGNIGSDQHMEYTVIGDTVNVAARLTSVAGAGEILLGETTWKCVQAEIDAESLPPLPLKGKREPAHVFRVLARKTAAV